MMKCSRGILFIVILAAVAVATQPAFGLTINAGNNIYAPGMTVILYGTADANSWIALEVDNSAGSPVVIDAEQVNSLGNWNYEFKLRSNAGLGTYRAYASNGTHLASTSFDVKNPDFTISLNSSAAEVLHGGSASLNVAVGSIAGYSGIVNLSASVSGTQPQGLRFEFSTLSGTPPFTSTLLISADSSVPGGIYTVIVRGISSVGSHDIPLSVEVFPKPDFTLSVSPAQGGVIAGSSITSNVILGKIGKHDRIISLIASTPPGVTATFNPNNFVLQSSSLTSVMNISVDSGVADAQYTINITGTDSGGTTHSTSYILNVLHGPDFEVQTSSISVNQGRSKTGTVSVIGSGGYARDVTLSVQSSTVPNGVTISFLPITDVPSFNSTMTITASDYAAVGNYSIIVIATGTDGKIRQSTFNLEIRRRPYFDISLTPPSATIYKGQSKSITVTVRSHEGYNSSVDLTALSPSGYIAATLSPTSGIPQPEFNSTMTISAIDSDSSVGSYNITVTGTGVDGTTFSSKFQLVVTNVPDFDVQLSQYEVSIPQGGASTIFANVTQIVGYNQIVNLSTAGQGPISIQFLPATGNVPYSSLMNISVPASVPSGTYNISVIGTGPGIMHIKIVRIIVMPAPDFSVRISPSSQTIQQDSSTNAFVYIDTRGNYGMPVNLSVTSPSGIIATLNPQYILSPYNPSTLSISVSRSVEPGTYFIGVVGDDGSRTRGEFFQITVTQAPDFNISINPSYVAVPRGSTTSATVVALGIAGYNNYVNLSTNTSIGVDISFSPPGGIPSPTPASFSTMYIRADSSAVMGIHNISIRGTGADGISHDATFLLNVTPPLPGFSMFFSPSFASVMQGNSTNVNLTVLNISNYSESINLSASGQPYGVSIGLSQQSGIPDFKSSLSISANRSAVPGNYNITITGKGADNKTSNATLPLEVVALPDFRMSASPNSSIILQGGSASTRIDVTSIGGYDKNVNLNAFVSSGNADGINLSLDVSSGTPTYSSNLNVYVSESAEAKAYNITIRGTSEDGIVHDVVFTLIVNPVPNFQLQALPNFATIARADTGSANIIVTGIGGYSHPVTLSISGLPTGVTAAFSQNSGSPAFNSTLTLYVTSNAPLVTSHSLTITASGADGKNYNTTFYLTIVEQPDFSISTIPSSISVLQGGSTSAIINIAQIYGYDQSVSLSVGGQPSGMSISLSPGTGTPSPLFSSTMLIDVESNVPAMTYPVTIVGQGSDGKIRNTTINITVNVAQPDFTMALSPSFSSVYQGGLTSATLDVTSVAGYSQNVTLTTTGLPAGVTSNFSYTNNRPPFSSTMSLSVSSSTNAGIYNVTVMGRGADGKQHSHTFQLVVLPQPDFSISIQPASYTLRQGSSANFTINVVPLSGYTQNVSLSTSSPYGITAILNRTDGFPTFSSILSIFVGASTSVGSYNITVTGIGSDAKIHNSTLQLSVEAAPRCPVCPADGPWSSCIPDASGRGSRSRSVYTCDANTNYICVSSIQNEGCCPTCPQPGVWSSCSGGLRTRTIFTCSDISDYRCIQSTEQQACVSAVDAAAAITSTEAMITNMSSYGCNVTSAENLLAQARASYSAGRYDEAKGFADQARSSAQNSPCIQIPLGEMPWLVIIAVVAVAAAGVGSFVFLRKKKGRKGPKEYKCYICGESTTLRLPCSVCGKFVCMRHVKDVGGKRYCINHVPSPSGQSQQKPAPPPSKPPPLPDMWPLTPRRQPVR